MIKDGEVIERYVQQRNSEGLIAGVLLEDAFPERDIEVKEGFLS